MPQVLSKNQVKRIIANAPPGTNPAGIIDSLRSKGKVLEGHPAYELDLKQSIERENAETQPFYRFSQWLTSPVGLGTEVGKGFRDLVRDGEISPQTKADFSRRLEDVGDVSRIAIPVAAAAATGGAGLPVALSSTFAAGAAGGAIEDLTEIGEDKSLGQIGKEAVVEGGIDASLDLATMGLWRMGKPVLRGVGRGGKRFVNKVVDSVRKSNQLEELTPAAREAIKAQIPEKLVRFVNESGTEDVKAYKEILDTFVKKGEDLKFRGSPKEIAGKTILKRVNHLLKQRKSIGKQIGDITDGFDKKAIDMTGQYNKIISNLRKNGIKIVEGKLTSVGRIPSADLPLYKEALEQFPIPDKETGKVVMSRKAMHAARQRMFEIANLAKERQNPFSDAATRDIDGIRKVLMDGINDEAYKNLSKEYARLNQPLQDFVRLIGFKGNLDDITTKQLRTGEVAMRVLGNAADRPQSVLMDLVDMAEETGFDSLDDFWDQLTFSDQLEMIFGQPSRSLGGQVERAGTRVASKSGVLREGISAFTDPTPKEMVARLKNFLDESISGAAAFIPSFLTEGVTEEFAPGAEAASPEEIENKVREMGEELTPMERDLLGLEQLEDTDIETDIKMLQRSLRLRHEKTKSLNREGFFEFQKRFVTGVEKIIKNISEKISAAEPSSIDEVLKKITALPDPSTFPEEDQ